MSYNGYKNYETWNVVLWISNDERLYGFSLGCADYEEFQLMMRELGSLKTPDSVAWNDSCLDIDAINEACFAEEG